MHTPDDSNIWPLLRRCSTDRPSPTLEASPQTVQPQAPRSLEAEPRQIQPPGISPRLNPVPSSTMGDALPIPFTYVRPPMWPVRILHSSGTIVRRAPISFDSLLADVNANHNPSLDTAGNISTARLGPR